MLFMHATCKHPTFMFSLKKLHCSELLNMVQVVESAESKCSTAESIRGKVRTLGENNSASL